MEENRQFQEMLGAAEKKLEGMSAQEIAERGGLAFDAAKNMFSFESFGRRVQVSYPDLTLDCEVDMWMHLTILQYMAEADGHPLVSEWISLSDLQVGGLVRGASFDRENDALIQRGIGKLDVETLRRVGRKMGAVEVSSKADLSLQFWFMPRFPYLLNLWFADEEFPASGKVLCDRAAEHYLKVEAAGTIAGLLLQELEKLCFAEGGENG
ncbi:MAG: DUF3786 domain-containing protein [Lachnospiraceae bacterium]|jgi:hypothetical protein|nr:DUF3786 domain-containing protein [Lachnospiraceae bacterium]